MTLTASARLAVAGLLATTPDLARNASRFGLDIDTVWTDGAGAGQANRVFADSRTLAASATEDLDFSGSLLDPLGSGFAVARLKLLLVHADDGNTNNVLVSRSASNGLGTFFGAAGDQIILRPDAWFAIGVGDEDATGYAVTAGTGDLLTFANSGAGSAVTYDIIAIGAAT